MLSYLMFLPLSFAMYQNIACQLSANAYCENFMTISERSTNLGYKVDTMFSMSEYDVNGYIVHNDDVTITILRGSHSIQNWIDNFDLIMIDYPLCNDCKVHEGFYNYGIASLEIVNRTLSQYPDHKHIFTGHSLGSSVIFLANALRDKYDLDTYVYTFGSPRMGNYDFTTYVNKLQQDRSFRYTHYQDIVPHVPTAIRFEHFDKEYYEDMLGNVTNNCKDNCSSQFMIKELNVDDHMWYLNNYMGCYIPVPDYLVNN